MEKKHEAWVDSVKVIACMLVLLGHLMQSMSSAGIIPIDGFYSWFNQTIYYFHVSLFFLCSGYLYQKKSIINTLTGWINNLLKKIICLGIPYLFFSSMVWVIKKILPGSGMNELSGWLETIFIHPTAPYWYLYCLVILFAITITFDDKKIAYIYFFMALIFKCVLVFEVGSYPYVITLILENEIWFVCGMIMAFYKIPDKLSSYKIFAILGMVFICLSFIVCIYDINVKGIAFFMGILGCVSIVGWNIVNYRNRDMNKLIQWLSHYTMPIYLMHSIFAATLRTLLFRIGISSGFIHISLGIFVSVFGPVVVSNILKKSKYLEIVLYPGRYIKKR